MSFEAITMINRAEESAKLGRAQAIADAKAAEAAAVEAGKAAVIATVEPVVATLLGIVMYHEPLSISAFCGILLVLGAIVVLNVKR